MIVCLSTDCALSSSPPLSLCLCVCVGGATAHVEVTGRFAGGCSLFLPCVFWEWSSGCQAWWQELLPAEPSCLPLRFQLSIHLVLPSTVYSNSDLTRCPLFGVICCFPSGLNCAFPLGEFSEWFVLRETPAPDPATLAVRRVPFQSFYLIALLGFQSLPGLVPVCSLSVTRNQSLAGV